MNTASPGAMSRNAVSGLEKFLNASQSDLTNEAALALMNRLDPNQLHNFLEAVNTLDDSIINALSRGRQLGVLADTPQLATLIHNDPVIRRLILSGFAPAPGVIRRAEGDLDAARELDRDGLRPVERTERPGRADLAVALRRG